MRVRGGVFSSYFLLSFFAGQRSFFADRTVGLRRGVWTGKGREGVTDVAVGSGAGADGDGGGILFGSRVEFYLLKKSERFGYV